MARRDPSHPLPTAAANGAGSPPRRIGLQDRLLLATALLITLTLLGSGAVFAWYSARQAGQLFGGEGSHLAQIAAMAAAPLLNPDERGRLQVVARQVLEDPGVRLLAIHDSTGALLIALNRTEDGQLMEVSTPALTTQRSDGYDLLVPIIDLSREKRLPVGYVGLVRAENPATAYVQNVVRAVTGSLLAVLAAALTLVFLLINRTFAPIRRLSLATRQVADGRFEPVDIRRGDSLGLLAESFNHMIRRLGEQKQRADEAHARLLEANLDLEQKVSERTGAIQAATERLSREIAEKEDFLRAVSHDLTAPLRNIEGIVTMILRKHASELPEEVCRRLDRVRRNVEHETALISELLELSRIKTRREQLEPVNLEEMLAELRGVFDNDLRERNVTFLVETRMPVLIVERARLRQVFQNLIDNAIKYMGDSPVRQVAIGARVGHSEAEFWVRDTGQGIAPEEAEKVFYVFRRGQKHVQVPGKGVGLASVKSIVENYNGTIWVESEPGQGSTFRFTINGRFVRQAVVEKEAGPSGTTSGNRAA